MSNLPAPQIMEIGLQQKEQCTLSVSVPTGAKVTYKAENPQQVSIHESHIVPAGIVGSSLYLFNISANVAIPHNKPSEILIEETGPMLPFPQNRLIKVYTIG